MPVYSFICPVCGTRFDQRRSFQEDSHIAACPNGHDGARRVYAATPVVFKGSGFYVTDSRKKPAKEATGD
jgi:putative FmdB family regulatory protein